MIACVIVWALIFGISPSLALIAFALTLAILRHANPTLLDRLGL